MRKLSTVEFIRRASAQHGFKYDYKLVKYISAIDKVKIICPEHGTFEQIPNNHWQGKGCPRCGVKYRSPTTSDTHTFAAKARKVHGLRYDYDLVEYINAKSKVLLICPEHGIFEQTPSNHLSGFGCNDCGTALTATKLTSTTEAFVQKAIQAHGIKYDYSLAEYKSSSEVVSIICPTHGEFTQTPDNHLQGTSCPRCVSGRGGFKTALPAVFYYGRICGSNLYKLGVTSRTIRERYSTEGRGLEVLRLIPFKKGNQARALETKLKRKHKSSRYFGPSPFKYTGVTEIYVNDILRQDSMRCI